MDDNIVGSTSAASATPATSTRGRPLKRTQPYDPEFTTTEEGGSQGD